jgi:DUF971 family protein
MKASEGQWPTELRLTEAGRLLKVNFESGSAFDLSAEYLRVMSPSAEVQGHSPEEHKTVGGKRNVAVLGVEPIGTYAVRLTFDDLHSTGIYSWDFLYDLGVNYADKWATYVAELAEKGLDRDKPGEK